MSRLQIRIKRYPAADPLPIRCIFYAKASHPEVLHALVTSV